MENRYFRQFTPWGLVPLGKKCVSVTDDRRQWYTTISWRQRSVLDAAAKWLWPVRWQWFVTLTFPWNVSADVADRKLRELINLLEREHRATVSLIAGKESRSRHDGSRVPWHFHLLLTSRIAVSREAIECHWLRLIRGGADASLITLRQEHIVADPYDADRRGIEYCLKAINACHGDWFIHGFEQCLPHAPGPSRPNHRTVRRQRRAQFGPSATQTLGDTSRTEPG